ncbi:MAG: ABC transporter permease [Pseudolysinimonas sp.]|uniref:ABC transporter permease n=1 Tax=Pseudolysinimonas sp. TaxID=2680009 RepID=UPI0032660B56
MLILIARRAVMSVVLIVVSSLAIFVLMSFVPGDPALTILGEHATPEALQRLRESLGLNRPLYEQYGDWLFGLIRGDLGTSIFSGEPVAKLIGLRVGVTVSLMVGSVVVIAVFGVALGLLSAVREGWVGRVVDAVSLLGFALPGFWIAIVLVAIFAVTLRVFPATGYVPPTVSPTGWLLSLVLPVIALSIGGITIIAKQMRDSARDVLARDYIRVLRATGLSERRILLLHVLRNAAVPTTTLLGLTAVSVLSGAVFIENVFVLPGLGSLVTSATLRHDLPIVLGVGVVFAVIVIVINLLVDLAYGVLNPKARVVS